MEVLALSTLYLKNGYYNIIVVLSLTVILCISTEYESNQRSSMANELSEK